MKVYKVKSNQNIFDIAIALYGSIEGTFDLLVNNSWLSFDSVLKQGQELYWNEDFVVFKNIVETLDADGVVPVNGERHVYYKDTSSDLRCVIEISPDYDMFELCMSGDGEMVVDWGDNSDLETIILTPNINKYTHYFNNSVNNRDIRLYGKFSIRTWDMSTISGLVLPTQPLVVDEVETKENKLSLQGLFLFSGTYSVKIDGATIGDLSPIKDMSLSTLELVNIDYDTEDVLNSYLKYIVSHHNKRRNCVVTLNTIPSGVYQEPNRGDDGNYIITSGMEAVYVITHEEAWNESGAWVFNICGKTYQYENTNIA